MKTFYFLAVLDNASSKDCKVIASGNTSAEAFASAAIMLSNSGYSVQSMQRVTEEQYHAAISVRVWAALQTFAVA